MILSMHDEPSRPSPSLLQLSLDAIQQAIRIDLNEFSPRFMHSPIYSEIWPGEHYKLLAGLTQALKPNIVIEIGTATGLSALCIKKYLPPGGKIVTFDLVPWNKYPNSHLKHEDFANGSLVQFVANLRDPKIIEEHYELLRHANLIFIDAAHDGVLEKQLLNHFQKIEFTNKVYLLFDDIRVWSMLKMWREIRLPKIDLTSFGHWSGTGLVEIN